MDKGQAATLRDTIGTNKNLTIYTGIKVLMAWDTVPVINTTIRHEGNIDHKGTSKYRLQEIKTVISFLKERTDALEKLQQDFEDRIKDLEKK